MSSLPGLTPQIGFTRFAAHNTAQLGQARVAVQSIHLCKNLLAKKMDARVISAFTRVFDALLPAHDWLQKSLRPEAVAGVSVAGLIHRREFAAAEIHHARGQPTAPRDP